MPPIQLVCRRDVAATAGRWVGSSGAAWQFIEHQLLPSHVLFGQMLCSRGAHAPKVGRHWAPSSEHSHVSLSQMASEVRIQQDQENKKLLHSHLSFSQRASGMHTEKQRQQNNEQLHSHLSFSQMATSSASSGEAVHCGKGGWE